MGWCRIIEIVLLTAVAGAIKSTYYSTSGCRARHPAPKFLRSAGRDGDRLWSGVARSLTIKSESHRTILTSIWENNSSITTATFDKLSSQLILESLSRRRPPEDVPLIIIIVALDERDMGVSKLPQKFCYLTAY